MTLEVCIFETLRALWLIAVSIEWGQQTSSKICQKLHSTTSMFNMGILNNTYRVCNTPCCITILHVGVYDPREVLLPLHSVWPKGARFFFKIEQSLIML